MAAPAPAPAVPRDAATAAAIEAVLAGEHRSAENRARDTWRHPLDTLLFFGIKPDMTVAEVWPGAGGWYTEVLAPLLAGNGKLYVAQMPADPGNPYVTARLAGYQAKLAARPDLYGKVTVTTLGADGGDIAPPASCDLVVTFRNLHSWMNLGYAPQAFAAMHRALKPGGILGVVGHRGPARPQDPRATNGYVDEQYAITADRVGGIRTAGTVRDQRESAGHEGLRAGRLGVAAGSASGQSRTGEISGDRRERSLHPEVQKTVSSRKRGCPLTTSA